MTDVSSRLRTPVDSVQSKDGRPKTATPPQSPVVEKKSFGKSSRHQSKGSVKEEPQLTRSDTSDFAQNSQIPQNPAGGDLSKRNTLTKNASLAQPELQPGIDPLSQHILNMSGAPNQKGSKVSEAVGAALNTSVSHESSVDRTTTEVSLDDQTKDKKKSGSLLSRFIGTKRRDTIEIAEESSNLPEGADAQLFYEPVESLEYSPKHPQPPGYIKVRSQGKREKEFNHMFWAQELEDHIQCEVSSNASLITESRLKGVKKHNGGATWALEFSKDGKYLAAGGQDKTVRVWSIISSRDDRRLYEDEEDQEQDGTEGQQVRLSAPVFRKKPTRRFCGHTGPVLDLSWSKNNFLLSSSMDKTVRLWHVSRTECLCAFKHSDFVTSIQFHPRDDRFFLAGSLDSKIRLWSIPDKSVALWNKVPEMITAVGFSPDGKTAIAGTINGMCLFYETEGLKYQCHFQIRKKSNYGKTAKGSKITGIQTMTIPPNDPNGEVKVLLTSNDSRIRLYNLRDKLLEAKFKGHENYQGQIQAHFSDDARYVICGSEDKKVYIWSIDSLDLDKKDRRPVEIFEAHNAITTVATLAPTKTRQLLSHSEDPVYDICNPPPVMLRSKSEVESVYSSKATDAVSAQLTPATGDGANGFKRPEESPAYLARTAHPNGNIIITADVGGSIRIFRQDCAFEKRKRGSETADSSSIFSRTIGPGALRRAPSLATQGSDRSRQDSSGSVQQPRDRILSWRQSIVSTNSLEQAFSRNEARSASPRKISHTSTGLASTSRRILGGSTPSLGRKNSDVQSISAQSSPALPPPSNGNGNSNGNGSGIFNLTRTRGASLSSTNNRAPPAPEITVRPPLEHADSDAYWRKHAWHDQMAEQLQNVRHDAIDPARRSSHEDEHGMLALPGDPLGREVSQASRLSSEASSDAEPGVIEAGPGPAVVP